MKKENIGYEAWNESIIKAKQFEFNQRTKMENDVIFGVNGQRCIHGKAQCFECQNEE